MIPFYIFRFWWHTSCHFPRPSVFIPFFPWTVCRSVMREQMIMMQMKILVFYFYSAVLTKQLLLIASIKVAFLSCFVKQLISPTMRIKNYTKISIPMQAFLNTLCSKPGLVKVIQASIIIQLQKMSRGFSCRIQTLKNKRKLTQYFRLVLLVHV